MLLNGYLTDKQMIKKVQKIKKKAMPTNIASEDLKDALLEEQQTLKSLVCFIKENSSIFQEIEEEEDELVAETKKLQEDLIKINSVNRANIHQ